MQRIGPAESPVVERTVTKRIFALDSKVAFRWGFINAVMAIAMFCEMSLGPTFVLGEILAPCMWYIVLALGVVFSLNAAYHFLRYLKMWYGTSVVELNTQQWKLMKVAKNEPGFRTPDPKCSRSVSSTASPGLVISPSILYASPQQASFLGQAPYSPTNSPFPMSPAGAGYSPQGSLSPSPKQSRSPGQLSTGGSPSFGASPETSFMRNLSLLNHSANHSASLHNHSTSMLGTSFNRSSPSLNATQSPMYREGDSSGLRSRFHVKHSPLKAEDCMTDLRDLDDFLRGQEEKDLRAHMGSPDGNNTGTGPSFWSFNRSLADFSPMLRRYQYQLACRSPQTSKAKDDDAEDGPAQYEAHEIWLRAGVHVDEVDIWIEHLRKWLGQTIMARLMREIETVNNTLVRLGCEDMEIGEVGISNLKQLAVTKGESLSTLNTLLPFLEVSSNQEYLVQRIKELGTGGCMSDFKWNGGSTYKGKPWTDNLPTDSEIVLHMLCCYMDARLPAHPKYYGKTFTTCHFLKTPDKPDFEKKDNLLIWQSKIKPPHYKVVLGDDTWNLPKGRNNLFYAILLFLHHIKEKNNGMLGRVNLGMSGINVLWILESHL